MSETKSVYLNSYGDRINQIVHDVERYHLQGGYGGSLNLPEISAILRGQVKEIERLQKVNDDLVEVLNQKEAQLNKLGENISNG